MYINSLLKERVKKMKRVLIFFISFSMIMTMGFSFQATAESEGGWHLKDVAFEDG